MPPARVRLCYSPSPVLTLRPVPAGQRDLRAPPLLVLLVTALCCAPPPPRFDNLVVIMIDTLRSDHLASYGYDRDTAPFLTSLSRDAIQLQGYATSSWTRPSVATLLSGLDPQRHQAISRSDHLPPDIPYLPALLADAGFVTACFMGNLNVSRKWGFERGFRHYAQTPPVGKASAAEVNRGAGALLPRLGRRFFLYLHYVDPHDPYRPSRAWDGNTGPYVQPRRLGDLPPSESDRRRLVDQYDGEIRDLDAALEALLADLDARGLLQGTLVAITSDHGEEFGEHGGLTHGRTLFEEMLRVPFLLWSDQGLPASRSSDLFYQLDFLPTMLDALGIEPAGDLDGASQWRRLVAGDSSASRQPYFAHLDLDRRGALSALAPPFKLIYRHSPARSLAFDLERAPGEEVTAGAGDERLQPLRALLLEHHNRQSGRAARRLVGTVDRELRRALAALGYMDVDAPPEELRQRVLPPYLDPAPVPPGRE